MGESFDEILFLETSADLMEEAENSDFDFVDIMMDEDEEELPYV